jgi:AraC family transcriptional regulator of adaptative response / DNA-3-methyladenine glycosylase II
MDVSARLSDAVVSRIEAGAMNTGSIEDLAAEFGMSSRQLRRVVTSEYGVSPVQLAQTRCLLMAKQLLTDTAMPIHDVVRASGFSSARRFHHLFKTRYRMRPMDLRRRQSPVEPGAVAEGFSLRLGYRPPLDWQHLVGFLAGRGASSAEQADSGRYLRTVRLGEWTGWIEAEADANAHCVRVVVAPSLLPALPQLRTALRRLFDLDASPGTICAHLRACNFPGGDSGVAEGLRVPGTTDGFELALRAIIGQQISVRAATTVFGRLVDAFGDSIETPFADLGRLTPRAADIAAAAPERLIACGLTGKRVATIQAVAAAVAEREITIEPGPGARAGLERLAQIPGIGPWTLQYIAMRGLRDPDAFPDSDLALLKAARCSRPAELRGLAKPWRPWRAYAAMHLWDILSAGG